MLGAVHPLLLGEVAAGQPRPFLDHAAVGGHLPERGGVVLAGGDGEALARFGAAVVGHPEDDEELEGPRASGHLGQGGERGRVDFPSGAQVDVWDT